MKFLVSRDFTVSSSDEFVYKYKSPFHVCHEFIYNKYIHTIHIVCHCAVCSIFLPTAHPPQLSPAFLKLSRTLNFYRRTISFINPLKILLSIGNAYIICIHRHYYYCLLCSIVVMLNCTYVLFFLIWRPSTHAHNPMIW